MVAMIKIHTQTPLNVQSWSLSRSLYLYIFFPFRICKISWRTWWKMLMTSRRRWVEAMAPLILMRLTWKPVGGKVLFCWDYIFYSFTPFHNWSRLPHCRWSPCVSYGSVLLTSRAGCFGRRTPNGWRQLLPGWGFNSSLHPRGHTWRQINQQGTSQFCVFPCDLLSFLWRPFFAFQDGVLVDEFGLPQIPAS